MRKVLVTGGSGFIGSCLVRTLIEQGDHVFNYDKRTYCANDKALETIQASHLYSTLTADILDADTFKDVLESFQPDVIFHLAAESHVDNSISSPASFIQTNIVGTVTVLQATSDYLKSFENKDFRFIHVSTDEVYGSLELEQPPFNNHTPYAPNSPYSASKAASDHLVRSWYKTYGFPAIVTHCSNNYGEWQFPEKLIPHMINCALSNQKLPIYGTGDNIRDWIYVQDHVNGLIAAYESGTIGETYNFGGNHEATNLEIVESICSILDKIAPKTAGQYADQISYVEDRLGHDYRYAVCNQKVETDLKWSPQTTFNAGLEKTVKWYVDFFHSNINTKA
jgi:dTDP-glucose 4,6-dehydratase